jgi:predicted MFS family arabinose efflux permease
LNGVRLRFQLLGFSAARLVINTGHRMIYPFLPTLARGVGVDLEWVALIVTARSALGIVSPSFASIADARGRKFAMLAGLVLFVGGMALVTALPVYIALLIGLTLATVGKMVFDPAMQAYLGDRVHYTQRGQAIAVTELGWSGAFIIGIPAAAWLIDKTNSWQAPFPFLAALGLLSVLLMWRIIPSDSGALVKRPSLRQGMRIVSKHPPAIAALVMAMFISLSNETIGIVFGAWMEDAFGLKIAALGAASAVIGLSELGGEGLVATIVDKLGKRRAIAVGIALNTLVSLLLPLLDFSVTGALVGLFFFYITFEFALVSAIPLMTELVPQARATLMAGNVAALSAGRMVGALLGPLLFEVGILANGTAAAVFDVLALVTLLMFVRQD